jgi:hypothetical protein
MNLREALWDIYQRNEMLNPQLVVEESIPEDAPLHSQFEWDNDVAGEAYRLGQAANMIRSVKIRFGSDGRGHPKSVRQWLPVLRDEDDTQRSYIPSEDLVLDDIQYEIKLRDFKREWKRFEARYGDLKEFGEIVRGGEAAA